MVALFSLLASLFLFTVASASPVQPEPFHPSRGLSGTHITTPLGVAQGTIPINGASRFAVKYASAQRWRDPVVASTWEFPCVSSARELMVAKKFIYSDIETIRRIQQHSRWRALSLL
jgi:hypothetical protein